MSGRPVPIIRAIQVLSDDLKLCVVCFGGRLLFCCLSKEYVFVLEGFLLRD